MIFNRILNYTEHNTGWFTLLVEYLNGDTTENLTLQFDHFPYDEELIKIGNDREVVVENNWKEDTAMRIFLSHKAAVDLLFINKQLVDFVFESGLSIEKTDEGSYIYVDWLLDEHRSIIEQAGGIIETK